MARIFLYVCAVVLQVPTISTRLVTHQLSGRPIHCQPVICRKGFQASFCKKNGTSDYCHLCPQGSKQDQVVDSGIVHYEKDIPKCVRVDTTCLLPETTPVIENGNVVRCTCDLSRGYIGDNLLCIKVKSCAPGFELTNTSGRCIPCPHGKYKNTSGYEFCQRHTRCETDGRVTEKEGNATADTVCGGRLSLPREMFLQEPSSTASTNEVTLPCRKTDCHSRKDQIIDKEDAAVTVYQVPTSRICNQPSLPWTIVIIVMLTFLQILFVGYFCRHHICKQTRRISKECRRPNPREQDIEMARESESSLIGIQKVGDKRQHSGKAASKSETMIDGDEEPRTFYPPINEKPAEPTAPDLSIPALACQPTHDT